MNALTIIKAYAEMSMKKLFIYRVKIVNEILGTIVIPISLYYFFWKSIIANNNTGYTLSEMIIYIIISNLIFSFTHIRADKDMENSIKTHRFGQSLLNPISFIRDIALRHIMDSGIRFLFLYFPIILFLLLIYGSRIYFASMALFGLTLVLAFILNATLSFMIGFLSFWLTEIWGIAAIRNILMGLLTGAVIPIDMFPQNLQKLFLMLPFPYMTYIPAKVISDPSFNTLTVINGFPISMAWIFVFLLISLGLFKRGVLRYTVRGI